MDFISFSEESNESLMDNNEKENNSMTLNTTIVPNNSNLEK